MHAAPTLPHDPLTDLVYRSHLAERPAFGPRATAFGLSSAVYVALTLGVLALTRLDRAPAPAPRSQVVVLREFDTYAPPPPPALGGSAAIASTAPSTAPAEATPDLMPLVPTASIASVAVGPGPSTAGGQAGGTSGGGPGGAAGGLVGGVSGGQIGSELLPPRFDAAYLQNPEPDYPSLSRRLGEEGRVILRVLVGATGQPEQIELRQSSGHARLDQAALDTVRRWRFTPARRGSETLAAWVLVPLSFQLDA